MPATSPRSKAIETWRNVAVGALIASVLGGLVYPPLGLVAAAVVITLLILATFRGRHRCGRLCPDRTSLAPIVREMSTGRRIPAWARSPWLQLSVLALAISGGAWSLANLPIANPGEVTGGVYGLVGAVFVRLCLIGALGAIFVGLIRRYLALCGLCQLAEEGQGTAERAAVGEKEMDGNDD